jgi:hypothetical protein
VTGGAYQTTKAAQGSLFISKFNFSASTSNGTITALTANVPVQAAGATVTFTPHVQSLSGGTVPTGTVSFTLDGKATAPVALDATGRTSYGPNTLAVGTHTVIASYSGDSTYTASTSPTLTETITLIPTSITVVSGAGQSAATGVAFSKPIVAQVTNINGVPVPNVTVSFSGPGLTFSSATAVTNSLGQATVTATPVLGGVLSATAIVSGTTPLVALFTENGVATASKTPPSFAAMAILPTGASAAGASLQAAIADFNADSYPDLATTNTIDASVTVLTGVGNGTFKAPVNYTTGSGPYGVATGDFNGDGKPDLAVVNGLDATVSILLNTAGTFPAAPSHTYAVGLQPYGVSVADLNRDGALDLVVTNNAANTLSVLLGNGDGTFKAAATYTTGNAPFGTVIADFNNDGYPDLAVWNYTDNTVSVLLNTKLGTFTAQTTYPTGADPFGLATGDFNGDGYPDIAVANLGSNTVSVLLNNKSGGFLAAVNYATGSLPTSALTVDLNGDGVLDLATTNLADGTVSILLGKGDGTFLAQTTVPAGTQPYALQAADFNGDGRTDLAVSNFFSPSIGILLQTASTTSGRVKTDPPRSLKTVPIQ